MASSGGASARKTNINLFGIRAAEIELLRGCLQPFVVLEDFPQRQLGRAIDDEAKWSAFRSVTGDQNDRLTEIGVFQVLGRHQEHGPRLAGLSPRCTRRSQKHQCRQHDTEPKAEPDGGRSWH